MTIRSSTHLLALAFLLLLLGWSATAGADETVDAIEPVVISDDIYKRTTQVESASSASSDASAGDEGNKNNQGHGNNLDGVDSSNPGKGKGGPDGGTDPSCSGSGDCVDDEGKGGGAAPSKDGGKK